MEHPTPNHPETSPEKSAAARPVEVPIGGTPLERVSAYLQQVMQEADANQQAVDQDDAQAIATLLAALLEPGTAMALFAETGEGDREQLRAECQVLRERPFRTPDLPNWLNHFEAYLDA